MLIALTGSVEVVIKAPASKRCSCAHLIDSYVWECLASDTQKAFELHLMECPACLRSVELERLLRRAIREHKTSCGVPCATRVRRIR
jgi:hypothetical protein